MEDTPSVLGGGIELSDNVRSILLDYSPEQHAQLEAWLVRLMGTYSLEGSCIWLVGEHRSLDGQRPIDIIAGGDLEAQKRLDYLIQRLEAGNF